MRVSESVRALRFCSVASWSGFIENKPIMPTCKHHAENDGADQKRQRAAALQDADAISGAPEHAKLRGARLPSAAFGRTGNGTANSETLDWV